MVRVEAIICAQTNVNNETDVLAAIAGTSLTTRTGWGKPKITHAAAFTDTNDISRVQVIPSGYNDANGFSIEALSIYSATTAPDPREWKLPIPVEVPENCVLTVSATSETAANTAIQVWMLLEYPSGGSFQPAPTSGGLVRRAWESGAAATSNVPYDGTAINDLQAGKQYRLVGVGKGAVNGETAGNIGPAYFGLLNIVIQAAKVFGLAWPVMAPSSSIVKGCPELSSSWTACLAILATVVVGFGDPGTSTYWLPWNSWPAFSSLVAPSPSVRSTQA